VLTDKLGLAFAIAPCNMPTTAACSGSVSGVNGYNRYAGFLRLVGDKLAKFTERPFAKLFSLLFPNRYPEAAQILNGYGPSGVFGSLNKLFGYYVVCVSLKASFLARKLFQMAFSGLAATFLKCFPESCNAASDFINLLTRIGHAVGGCGEVDDAHIHAQVSDGFDNRIFWGVYYKAEVKLASLADKIGLTDNPAAFKLRMFAEGNRYLTSALQGNNRNGLQFLEGDNALVVDNGRVFFKAVQPLSVGLVRFDDFADGPDRKLGGEIEPFSNVPVTNTVKADLPEHPLLESNLRDMVAGVVERLHGAKQRALLSGIGKQLNLKRKLHLQPLTFFNVPLNGFRRDMPGGADIIRRCPQMPLPKLLPEPGKLLEKSAGKRSLEYFYNCRGRLVGFRRAKKMHMVRHYLKSKHFISVLPGYFVDKRCSPVSNIIYKNFSPILRYPYHVIVNIVDTMSGRFRFVHAFYYTPCDLQHQGGRLLMTALKCEVSEA
jgi:hypothetical protein